MILLQVIAQYIESIYASNHGHITGFDVGEVIFYRLYKSIRMEFLNYDD